MRVTATGWSAHTGRWRDGTRNGQATTAVILYKTVTGHDNDASTAAARNESSTPTDPTHPRAYRWRAIVRPSRRTDDGRIDGAPMERPRVDRRPFHCSTLLTPPPTADTTPTSSKTWPYHHQPSYTTSHRRRYCPVCCGGGPCRTLVRVTYPLFFPAALPAHDTQRALKMARIFLFRPYYHYDSLLHFTRNDVTIIIIRRWRIADDNRILYYIYVYNIKQIVYIYIYTHLLTLERASRKGCFMYRHCTHAHARTHTNTHIWAHNVYNTYLYDIRQRML